MLSHAAQQTPPQTPLYPPYTQRTNDKAERYIQTALREWAYARTYRNSAERTTLLDAWLHDYNFYCPMLASI